jgi:hypothetical protein
MSDANEFWGSAPEDFRIGFELRVDFQSITASQPSFTATHLTVDDLIVD